MIDNNELMLEGLTSVINGFIKMKQALSEPAPMLKAMAPTPEKAGKKETEVDPADFDTFEKLKKALESDKWPVAVKQNLICNPESLHEKIERGRGIVELMVEDDLRNLKFLDFGCGDGFSTNYVSEEKAAISVGYDLVIDDQWEKFEKHTNLLFTNDFAKVKENGPYDAVMIFDVLDHAIAEDPTQILTKAASVLSDKGKIYMRTHPWTSRHATHLYHELNKAYVHLVFTDHELSQIINSKYKLHNIGIKLPLMTYGKYIKEAGLVEASRREIKEPIEPFFKIPKIADRIMKLTQFEQFPEWQMSLQFIDYVLKKTETPVESSQ